MRWLIPKRKRGVVGRFVLAAFFVIACTAGATTVAGLLQVKTLVNDFHQKKGSQIKHVEVAVPQPGQPQTLLLIGADRRLNESAANIGNTDTMMLVRINDSSDTINVLSIPRDLRVTLPGIGYAKLNAAYSDGGPNELINVLREQVFPGFKINHLLVVSFLGFAHLINDIGCVYGPVDQRYYNHNDLLGDATNFSNIDLQPGYQKMCGGDGGASSALAFVRYRHTDTDEVRNARQQDFLRWAKGQFSSTYLVDNYARLARDFGENVQTDKEFATTDGLINLFDDVVNADGHQIKTIKFPESFGQQTAGAPDYVYLTSQEAAAQAYKEFMSVTVAKPAAKKAPRKKRHRSAKPGFRVPGGMAADPNDGIAQAKDLGNTGIPIYYPKYIPSSYSYCFYLTENCSESFEPSTAYAHSYPRNYTVTARDGHRYHAWVMTLLWDANTDAGLASGLYFNVQGLAWKNPPLLGKPTKTKRVNGKKLLIYSQGGLISTVAWETPRGVYWIQNTLQNTIPNNQMIAMAATFTRYNG